MTLLFKIKSTVGSVATVLMNSLKCHNVFGNNIPPKCSCLLDMLQYVYIDTHLKIVACKFTLKHECFQAAVFPLAIFEQAATYIHSNA